MYWALYSKRKKVRFNALSPIQPVLRETKGAELI